ncbi:MAG: secretin N-terminal domain-containing protein [Nitrospiria bacterium]
MTRRAFLPPTVFPVLPRFLASLVVGVCCALLGWPSGPAGPAALAQEPPAESAPRVPALPPPGVSKISLDFKDVDLPVLVKFFSELTRKNFVIDEKVKGKVTIFSPSKLSIDDAYRVFLSVLELKGFAAVPAGEVIQILPIGEVPPDRLVEVYPLTNANAEELVKVLNVVVARPSQTGPSRPGMRPQGEFEGTVQILADKPTNTLVITATARDLAILKDVIRRLDTSRRQVYVETVIMEVAVNRQRDLGADLTALFGAQNASRNLTVVGGVNDSPPALSSLLSNTPLDISKFSAVNLRSVLTALQSRDDVNILSTPQILTSDNQKAEIVVGENRPFPTGQSQTSGGNTLTTIERRDVGITLRLTPQIMESDLVKLDVFQEISTVSSESQSVGSTVLGPTTNKRSATTSVLVQDGQTAVIGGLMRDNIIIGERKIPLLGDIPILGWAFKFRTKRTEKTNLLIFLTPTILKTPAGLNAIKTAKSEVMTGFLDGLKIPQSELQRAWLQGINPPAAPKE